MATTDAPAQVGAQDPRDGVRSEGRGHTCRARLACLTDTESLDASCNRLATALAVPAALAALPAHAAQTSCTLTYNMAGGGVFYKHSTGDGVIKCDNGQTLAISIESKGGGLTFGKSKIENGLGKFTPVHDIRDLVGGYATAEANAGKSDNASKAQVVTKGSISLALTGKGTGRTLGVSFGSFIISERE